MASASEPPKRPNRALPTPWIVVVVALSLLVIAVAGGALWLRYWLPGAMSRSAGPGGGGGGGGGPPGGGGGGMAAFNVMVGEVVRKEVAESIRLVSTVDPVLRTTIGSEMAGRVKAVARREGEQVAANDVIVELDKDLLNTQISQARATLDNLQQKLGEAIAGPRPQEISEAEATVSGLEAQLTQADYELNRLTRLLDENRANEREVVIARALRNAASSKLAEAKARLALLKAGTRPEQIAQAKAAVEQQRQQVAYIQQQIDKTSIRAPFAGRITRLMTEQGQWVSPGTPVAEVIDLHQVFVVVDVPERAIDRVERGLPVTVEIADLAMRRAGVVERIIPQADPSTHTFPVKVLVDNDERSSLKPGMFATCLLPLGRPTPQLLVPRSAVVRVMGVGDVIYVVGPPKGGGPPGAGPPGGDPATGAPAAAPGGAPGGGPGGAPGGGPPLMAVRTSVLTGAFFGDWQVIQADVKPGDLIAVRGNAMLANIPAPMLPVVVTGTSDSARLPAGLEGHPAS